MPKYFTIILLSFSSIITFSQEIVVFPEIGVGFVANFNTTSSAIEIRYRIPVIKQFSLTPRICYYHPLNVFQELYVGFDVVYHYPEILKLKFYNFVGPYYNYLLNYERYDEKVSTLSSFGVEIGIGFEQKIGKLSPYLEGRYNTKWSEFILVIGMKIIMNKKKWKKKIIKCSDFD